MLVIDVFTGKDSGNYLWSARETHEFLANSFEDSRKKIQEKPKGKQIVLVVGEQSSLARKDSPNKRYVPVVSFIRISISCHSCAFANLLIN